MSPATAAKMAAPHTGGAQLVAPAASIIIVFFILLNLSAK